LRGHLHATGVHGAVGADFELECKALAVAPPGRTVHGVDARKARDIVEVEPSKKGGENVLGRNFVNNRRPEEKTDGKIKRRSRR
jgi:hypothetical protein